MFKNKFVILFVFIGQVFSGIGHSQENRGNLVNESQNEVNKSLPDAKAMSETKSAMDSKGPSDSGSPEKKSFEESSKAESVKYYRAIYNALKKDLKNAIESSGLNSEENQKSAENKKLFSWSLLNFNLFVVDRKTTGLKYQGKSYNFGVTVNELTVNANDTKKYSAAISLRHHFLWGAADNGNSGLNGVSGDTNYNGYKTAITKNNSILIGQSYFKASHSGSDFTIGRYRWNIGNGKIVSPNSWEPNGFSVDGMAWTKHLGEVDLSLNAIQMAQFGFGKGIKTFDPEQRVFSLNSEYKSKDSALSYADIHAMYVTSDETEDVDSSGATGDSSGESIFVEQTRMGGELKGDLKFLNFDVTGAMHFGRIGSGTFKEHTGTMVDTEVNIPLGQFKLGLNYHMDSGGKSDKKDKTYDPLFYDRHFNAGLMDVIQWGNLTYLRISPSFAFNSSTSLALDWYSFSRTSIEGLPRFDANGANYANAVTSISKKKDIGTEFDLILTHSFGPGFGGEVRGSVFTPGNLLKEGGVTEAQTLYAFSFYKIFQ